MSISTRIAQTKSDVRLAKDHVRSHRKTYIALGLFGVYTVGNYRGFVRAYNLIPGAVEAAKAAGHADWVNAVYAKGNVVLDLPLDEYNLFLGAAVNAGKITQEIAKESSELAAACVKACATA